MKRQPFMINAVVVGHIIKCEFPRVPDEAWRYETRMGRPLYWGPTADDCKEWAVRNIEHGEES